MNQENVRRGLFLLFAALVGLGVYVANRAETGDVSRRITKIESPCQRYGKRSKECRRSFDEAIFTLTHAQACAVLRKAGLEIDNCRGARLEQERGRDEERAQNGGDAQTNPQPGSQQPSPQHGGSGDGGNGGGVGNPPNDNPAPSSAAPSSPAPINVAPTLEGVTGTVCSVDVLGVRTCP